jgi:RsiW-degrading membrane proteinase PrsW (M82 family)
LDFIYLLALALGPVFILVHLAWTRDRFREPLGNVAMYLLFGALSVVPVLLVGGVVETLLPSVAEHPLDHLVSAFVGVALVEEGGKLLLLRLRARRDAHLDEPFDWVVYAVSVSLGFAAVENILYVLTHGAETGWLRAFTAVPCHALFGTVMGARLALRAGTHGRVGWSWSSLLLPVFWHGAYDAPLFLMDAGHGGAAMGLAWLVVVVWLWQHSIELLLRLRARQEFPPPPLLQPLRASALVWRRRR